MVSLRDGVLVDGAVGQGLGGCGSASIAHLEVVLGRGAGNGLVGCSLLNCTYRHSLAFHRPLAGWNPPLNKIHHATVFLSKVKQGFSVPTVRRGNPN